MSRNLIYTIAYDNDGERLYGNLAKLLVSSITRTGFEGEVVVFHNGERPLFQLGRPQVSEIALDLEGQPGCFQKENDVPVAEQRWALKHRVADILLQEYEWDRLLFIDADCLAVRPLDEIFAGNFHLAVYRERNRPVNQMHFNCFLSEEEMNTLAIDGINSGVFCVDRSIAASFFAAWGEAEKLVEQRFRWCTDQAALNRVVLDHDYNLKDLTSLVGMPYNTSDTRNEVEFGKSIIHWVGAAGEQKLKVSYGLFAETFLYDPALTLFNLMEP